MFSDFDLNNKLNDLKDEMFNIWRKNFSEYEKFYNMGKEVKNFYDVEIKKDDRFKDAKNWYRILFDELNTIESKKIKKLRRVMNYIKKRSRIEIRL